MNKKIVQINSVCNGSTGKIMGEIEAILSKNGYNVTCFYGRRKPFKDKSCEKICNKFSVLPSFNSKNIIWLTPFS